MTIHATKRIIVFQFSLLILLFLFFSCNQHKKYATNKIHTLKSKDFVQITNWNLLDTFRRDSLKRKEIFDLNFLHDLNSSESAITLEDLVKHTRNHTIIKSENFGVDLGKILGKKHESVAYLYCTLDSRSPQEITLLFSGIKMSKIWLNNQLIQKTSWKSVQTKFYEEYIPIHLKKGENLLLIKVDLIDTETAGDHWGFNTFLSTNCYAKENYLKDYKFTLFDRSLVDSTISVYLGPYINDSLSYEIKDVIDSSIYSVNNRSRDLITGKMTIQLTSLPKNKLYRFKLNLADNSIEQDFYLGNYDTAIHEITNLYNKEINLIPTDQKANLTTSFNRLLFVKNKMNALDSKYSEVRHWDLSRVFYINELLSYFHQKNKNYFNSFISSYTSTIDNSQQYYCSYIPKSLFTSGKKIPVVFLMPFTYNHINYLQTWGISNYDQMLWEAKIAEENGFALVWVDLRSHPGLYDIGMTAFNEIFRDIKKRINVDDDRLFLLGNSASSAKALTLATNFPSKFAGLMLLNPSLELPKNHNMPFDYSSLSNLNIYMQHSTKDELVPIDKAKKLYETLKSEGMNIKFQIVNDNTHFISPKDAYRKAFAFMRNLKREPFYKNVIISNKYLRFSSGYGIDIIEKYKNGKTSIKTSLNGNTLQIYPTNVQKFSIDIALLDSINRNIKYNIHDSVGYDLFKTNESKLIFNRKYTDNKDKLIKNNEIEGPITHFFANSFKLVYNKEQEKIKQILDSSWLKMYFTKIPSIRDENLTIQDIESNNLLIIGSKHQNPLIKSIVDQLPISSNNNTIKFKNYNLVRNNIYLSFIYPNPKNKKKYVYFIFADSFDPDLLKRDFANDLKYDYEIFYLENGGSSLLSKGDFDNNWK